MSNYFLDIETTGLDSIKHRVTCIVIVDEQDNVKVFSDESEEKMLKEFSDWLITLKPKKKEDIMDISNTIWAKNMDGFDFPFLRTRMMKYGLNIYNNDKEIEYWFEDINHKLSNNPKTKRKPSLKDTCELLGLDGKLSDGLSAIYMWKWKEYKPKLIVETQDMKRQMARKKLLGDIPNHTLWSKLIDYCVQDAKLVKQIWEKLK